MKNINLLYAVVLIIGLIGCEEENCKPEIPSETPSIDIVSQFVYDGMSRYYKWADEVKDKKPTVETIDPEKYFYSLRSEADVKHDWSWIIRDAKGLVAGLSGISSDFGYSLAFKQMGDNKIYAIVKYVYPNTPADRAGIKRLNLIGELFTKPIMGKQKNGKLILNDYDRSTLLGSRPGRFTFYEIKDKKIVKIKGKENILLQPEEIDKNPILKDSIYNIGNKKIGYLFYTKFISKYNNDLYKVFSKFKEARVTDLILDLRYNHGGALDAATYLTSMIAPLQAVEKREVLTSLSFNQNLNKKWGKENFRLGRYDKETEQNPKNVNLNLNKVYIIATEDSFSASEFTTFCLRPFMKVVHIGGHTGGKYTVSTLIFPHKKDYKYSVYSKSEFNVEKQEKLKNWAMQPIVAIYTNKYEEDFIKTDGLKPDYPMKEGFGSVLNWTQMGDTKDTFLGQALYLITGKEDFKPQDISTRAISKERDVYFIERKAEEIIKNAVIIQ